VATLVTVLALGVLALVEPGSSSVSSQPVVNRSSLNAFFTRATQTATQVSGPSGTNVGSTDDATAVASADSAAALASSDVDALLANLRLVNNRIVALRDRARQGNPGAFCGKLLHVRANFDARIQAILARNPGRPGLADRLLQLQANVDARIDALLGRLGCTVSGAL